MSLDLNRALSQEIRGTILAFLYKLRPTGCAHTLIGRALGQANLAIAARTLEQELNYLTRKGLLLRNQELWSITAYGCDVLEGSVGAPLGIPKIAEQPEQRILLQELRWRICLALHYARPLSASSGLLWRALDESDLPITAQQLNREVAYLQDKEIVTVAGDLSGDWKAELSAAGVDLVEYTIDCPPGIGRPEKYWE
jgi:hypothetical protein